MSKKPFIIGGKRVAAIGQGTWNMGNSHSQRAEEIAAIRRGIELGMNLIDTAEMYGDGRSEELVGEAIKPFGEEVCLVTKVLPSNASRQGTIRACEASLKRLGISTLDLYLLHWPGSHPLEETLAGFEALAQAGKIRSWGVSNFDVDEMEDLYQSAGGPACAANQVLYNPEHRGIEFDLMPWCEGRKLPIMAYSPVGQGGKLLKSNTLKTIAAARSATPAQVALAWELSRDVLVIPKAGSIRHVEENWAAAQLELDPLENAAIDSEYPAPTRKVPLETL